MLEYNGIYQIQDKGGNYVLIHVSDTFDPDSVKIQRVVGSWVVPTPNQFKGEPCFGDVNKPGVYSSFPFWPIYDSNGRYKATSILAGVFQCPRNMIHNIPFMCVSSIIIYGRDRIKLSLLFTLTCIDRTQRIKTLVVPRKQ